MDKGTPPEIPQPHGAAGPCSAGEGRRLWRDRSALTWWGYGRGGKAGQVPAHGLPQHPVQLPNTHPQGMLQLLLTRAATREEYLQRKGMGKSHNRGSLPQKVKRKLKTQEKSLNPKSV